MQSDDELIGRVIEEDAEAFEILLARHGEAVRRHLARMVRDQATADDLTQEVFLRLWTRAEQWRRTGSFRAWLFRVATNVALNHLRTVRRRRHQPLDAQPTVDREDDDEGLVPGWMIDAAALGPHAWLELAEQREIVRRLVEALPEAKRDVLRLMQEHEMDVGSVADSLGVPPGTVRSRLHYALRQLADAWRRLESKWEDDV